MTMYTRKSKTEDLEDIMQIVNDAKQFLKDSGSSQWQNGYPSEKDISADISQGFGYCFMYDGEVVAYAAVVEGVEPTYNSIEGKWQNTQDMYATIHRICFSSKFQGKGLAKIFLSNIFSIEYSKDIKNFRVDTHRLNKPMQNLATHNGFEYRGIIEVTEDIEDPKRLAYELNLD